MMSEPGRQASKQNPPRKHHYIPVFYLSQWKRADDNMICQLSRPNRKVVPNRRSPLATGFDVDLYTLRGFAPEVAQQIEQRFFAAVDDAAAVSLDLLLRYGHKAPWTFATRSAWSRFLISLLLRCPEDLAAYRDWWPHYFAQTNDEFEQRYRQAATENEPLSLSEAIKQLPPTEIEKNKFEAFMQLIEHDSVMTKINKADWRVLQMPEDAPSLMTSDRPVIRSHSIMGPEGHIALPIGPRLLFVASHDLRFLERLRGAKLKHLAKECNRQVVSSAVSLVFSVDDKQLPFVQKHMGSTPQPRVIEDLIRRHPI